MARVYISNMDKLPEDCRTECPLEHDAACCAHGDRRELEDFYHRTGRRADCPLRLKRQPNPFNSVVQLLRDFDLDDEEMIKDLADYICQMFKDGAYD